MSSCLSSQPASLKATTRQDAGSSWARRTRKATASSCRPDFSTTAAVCKKALLLGLKGPAVTNAGERALMLMSSLAAPLAAGACERQKVAAGFLE